MRVEVVGEFRRAVGPRVAHVTAAENLEQIRAHGLWSAQDLAVTMQVAPDTLPLRAERIVLAHGHRRARLNHQRPILHGKAAATRILDGHSPRSWAEALDRRVFLWPERRGARFARSIAREHDIAILWLDARRLADALFDAIDLAPINTGNFTQGGAHAARGDWIYVPLVRGLDAFRENRRQRLGAASRDGVAEISLRRGVPPDLLAELVTDAPEACAA